MDVILLIYIRCHKTNNKVASGIETVTMHNFRKGTIKYMELLLVAALFTSIVSNTLVAARKFIVKELKLSTAASG